ncbi:MAG: DeoR/GlpR family DNA-binding transcription regulator, partial [Anaerolineae bacterium]
LDQHRFLTVITNSLAIAQQLLDAGGATVVMPGGRLRSETASLIGLDGLGMLDQFNIRKGFFGAHGITVEEGLTDVSAEEADVKRPLVARCRQVIAVLDATKWGQVGVATFATLDQVDAIITNREAAGDLVEQVKTLGPEIILV